MAKSFGLLDGLTDHLDKSLDLMTQNGLKAPYKSDGIPEPLHDDRDLEPHGAARGLEPLRASTKRDSTHVQPTAPKPRAQMDSAIKSFDEHTEVASEAAEHAPGASEAGKGASGAWMAQPSRSTKAVDRGILLEASERFGIRQGISESEGVYFARVLYSILGLMAYTSVLDEPQNEISTISKVHLKRRIKAILASYLALYPDLSDYFCNEEQDLSEIICDAMLKAGVIYSSPYRLSLSHKRECRYDSIVFMRGISPDDIKGVSGLGFFTPFSEPKIHELDPLAALVLKQDNPMDMVALRAYFGLETESLQQVLRRFLSRAIWHKNHLNEETIEFLRVEGPFTKGYWISKDNKSRSAAKAAVAPTAAKGAAANAAAGAVAGAAGSAGAAAGAVAGAADSAGATASHISSYGNTFGLLSMIEPSIDNGSDQPVIAHLSKPSISPKAKGNTSASELMDEEAYYYDDALAWDDDGLAHTPINLAQGNGADSESSDLSSEVLGEVVECEVDAANVSVLRANGNYYLYYYLDGQMLLSMLPTWMVECGMYRTMCCAILKERGALPAIEYTMDGSLVHVHLNYLLPQSELNIFMLYSWPEQMLSAASPFVRCMDEDVFDVLKELFISQGYTFQEGLS